MTTYDAKTKRIQGATIRSQKSAVRRGRRAEAQARRDAWRLAVSEGRVVNFDGSLLKSFATVADAEAAVAKAHADGLSSAFIPKETK